MVCVGDNRIRKIDCQGIITTVAGTGKEGYSGDGGAAKEAVLNRPAAIAIDEQGNYYIADRSNSRIRRVNTSGIINTVAGTGLNGFNGDEKTAVSASLNRASGVAVDRVGNIYVADRFNNRVRCVNRQGVIRTIAGNEAEGFTEIKLFDMFGEKIVTKELSPIQPEQNLCIDMKGISSGVYKMQILSHTGVVFTRNVVVQR